MPTPPTEPANSPLDPLPPFPEGWYFIASRRDVQRAKLIQKTWMGESIVAWCDENGRVCVAESFCPHLGSDLGPAAGGASAAAGSSVPSMALNTMQPASASPLPMPTHPGPRGCESSRHRKFSASSSAGGASGSVPQWSLPADPPDQAGWTDFNIRTLRFPGHPQETTENSVDMAHLGYVQSYGNVNLVGPVSVDGPRLESRFDFRTTRAIAGIATLTLDFSVNTLVVGLGYSFVDYREHSIGMDMRLWVLATPVDGTLIDFSLVSQVREIRTPRRRIAGLAWLPRRLRAPIINKVAVHSQLYDVQQDVVIWSRKRYRSSPRLCRSDGEIMTYRAYCAQFYPDPHDSARTRSVAAAVKHTASRSRQRAPALGIPEVQSASQASSGNQNTP